MTCVARFGQLPGRSQRPNPHRARKLAGFTLIELLVAISIMALLAVLSWRGLDGMARAQSQTSQRSDEVLTLQAGLAQWKLDLDSMSNLPQISSLDWDGRVLRLTRRSTLAGDDLQVVAWTRQSDAGGQWVRWQSAPLRSLPAWNEAWARAANWAQFPSSDDRRGEVVIVPLSDWQIFFHRGGAWSNSLSSEGASTSMVTPPQAAASAPGAGAAGSGQLPPALPAAAGTVGQNTVPDGVRVVLTLAPNQAITGQLTVDWVLPTLSGAGT